MPFYDLLGSAFDFLGGGLATLAIFIVAVLVLWALWHWILHPLLKFFGLGRKSATDIARRIGRRSLSAWSHSRDEQGRIREEAEREKMVHARLQQEQENIKRVEQILTDPNASAQTKANALRSFFASQQTLLETDRETFLKEISSLNKDKRDTKATLWNFKKAIRKQKDLLGQVMEEARELARLGSREASIGKFVALLERANQLEELVVAFEKQDQKFISRLVDIAKQRRKIEKNAEEIVKRAENVVDRGQFAPQDIAALLALTTEMKEKWELLFAFSNEVQKVGMERWQNTRAVLQSEGTIAQIQQQIEKAVQAHEAMKLEIERKTKVAA